MLLSEIFSELGFTERDTFVFQKLFEGQGMTVGSVAERLKMPRSTANFIILKFKKAGLVHEFKGRGGKQYICAPEEEILSIFRQHEKKMDNSLTLLEKNLPELEKMEHKNRNDFPVQWVTGKEVVHHVARKIVERHGKKAVQKIFYNPKVMKDVMPHAFEPDTETGSATKYQDLAVDSEFARTYARSVQKDPNIQIKFLPPEFDFSGSISVIEGELRLTSFFPDATGDALRVRIESPALIETVSALFDCVWKTLD